MDLTLYKTKASCATLVTEKTGLTPSDLDTLLDVSAGTAGDVTYYRPYYVAAKLLATRRTQLVKAEGAEFVDPLAVAREYLGTQQALDAALGLDLPDGMEARISQLQPRTVSGGSAATDGAW